MTSNVYDGSGKGNRGNSFHRQFGNRCVKASLLFALVVMMMLSFSGDMFAKADIPDRRRCLILMMNQPSEHGNESLMDAYIHGFKAHIEYISEEINKDFQVVLHLMNSTLSSPRDIHYYLFSANLFCNARPDQFLGGVGYPDESVLEQALQLDYVKENNFVFFAPVTWGSKIRQWSENILFTRADPRVELLTLLNYALNIQGVRRLAYMYTYNTEYGEEEYAILQQQLNASFNTTAYLYNQTDVNKIDDVQFSLMVNSAPQAIIMYGAQVPSTMEFFKKVLQTTELNNTIILAPFVNELMIMNTLQEMRNNGEIDSFTHPIVISGTNYLATEDSLDHVRTFQKEMNHYLENKKNNHNEYIDNYIYLHNLTVGQMMMSGWIAAYVSATMLTDGHTAQNRSTLQTKMFDQNRFVINNDFLLGIYGGECTNMMSLQGATCECNQGGHTAFLKQIIPNATNPQTVFLEQLENASLALSPGTCYTTDFALKRSLQIFMLAEQDDPELLRVGNEMQAVLNKEFDERQINSVNNFQYNFVILNTTLANDVEDVKNYRISHYVDVLTGPVSFGNPAQDITVINPVFKQSQPRQTSTNFIYLVPTVEQQIYMFYDYINTNNTFPSADKTVNFFLNYMSDSQANSLKDTIARTVEILNGTTPNIRKIDLGLSSNLYSKQINFVIGLKDEDVIPITDLLTKPENDATVVLSYQDFAMFYDRIKGNLTTKTTDETRWERLIIMSNMPVTYTSPTNDLLSSQSEWKLQHSNLKLTDDNITTPIQIETAIFKRFTDQLELLATNQLSPSTLTTIYSASNISIGDMSFGPFINCDVNPGADVYHDGSIVDCENRNYGAREIFMFSFAHWMNSSSTLPMYGPYNPLMAYNPQKGHLTESDIGAIVVGVFAGVVIIIFLLFLLFNFLHARHMRNALTDESEPMTVVFVDIDYCTELWAGEPETMPRAVAAYYRLVRETIDKYWAYEVKIIGDAFMIVCKDAYTALQLARDVQIKLLLHDWQTNTIDAAYRRYEENKMNHNPEYISPTLNMDPLQYAARWNGLRARIGIHTGLCDISFSKELNGFDYSGEAVQFAACLTSVANGGQILTNEATWYALSYEEREHFDYNNLDAKRIHGVGIPLEVYQLNAIPGRAYPALRLDAEPTLPDMMQMANYNPLEGNEDGIKGKDSSELQGINYMTTTMAVSGPQAAITSILTDCFSIYPAARRVQEVIPLVEKWHIPCPPTPIDRDDDSQDHYFRSLISRLAAKLMSVRDKRRRGSLSYGLNAIHRDTNDPSTLRSANPLVAGGNTKYVPQNFNGDGEAGEQQYNGSNYNMPSSFPDVGSEPGNTIPIPTNLSSSEDATASTANLRRLFNAARQAHASDKKKKT